MDATRFEMLVFRDEICYYYLMTTRVCVCFWLLIVNKRI